MNRNALIVLSALLHLYIGARLVPSLLDVPPAAATLLAVLAMSAIVIPVGMMFRRRAHRFASALQWTSLIAMGLAYVNIHTTGFPGGEIRGFLLAAPSGVLVPTLSQTLLGVLALMLAAGGWLVLRRHRA